MNAHAVIESGAVIEVPLSKLKKSPKNARKTPHGEAAIEALAASIAAKGLLQAPVVEPETGEDGEPTGFYLVTIGEGEIPAEAEPDAGTVEDEPEDEGMAPLSERLVLDLTAYKTMGLRDALAGDPTLALTALVHALALKTFYPPYDQSSCVEVKLVSSYLDGHAPGASESSAGRRIAERHEGWAQRLPRESGEAWGFVIGLDGGALLDLLAHCVSLGVNAVRNSMDRKPGAWAHAEVLAQAAGLDMTRTWTATVSSYLGRVTNPGPRLHLYG